MNTLVTGVAALLTCGLAAVSPLGYEITWYTLDGGGVTLANGGAYRLGGTAGQPDAGRMTGGAYALSGGFWSGAAYACWADCDTSTGMGVLDIFDFLCFQNRFAAGDPYACDCDTGTGQGVCDIFDFLCYQNIFANGCP
jgi:hypothetical protein